MANRFGTLKDYSRVATCRHCKETIGGGSERMYDNMAGSVGPTCMTCVNRLGGASATITDDQKGLSATDARFKAIEDRLKALEDAQSVTF